MLLNTISGIALIVQVLALLLALRLFRLGRPLIAMFASAALATGIVSSTAFFLRTAERAEIHGWEWFYVAEALLTETLLIALLLWLNHVLPRLDSARRSLSSQARELERCERGSKCLVELSSLYQERDLDIDELLTRAASILSEVAPEGWTAKAKIRYFEGVYGSPLSEPADIRIEEPLQQGGKICGSIVLELTNSKKELDTAEQADLKIFFWAVALRMGEVLERKQLDADARRHREYLQQAQKMDSLGILVSGVAHEVNNPNHFIMSGAGTLLRVWDGVKDILDEHIREHGDTKIGGMSCSEVSAFAPELLQGILSGATKIKDIVQELRDFAMHRPGETSEELDLNAVVKSAVTLLSNMLRRSTNNFSLELGEGIPLLTGYYRRLEQALISIITNACQSLPDRDAFVRVATRYRPESGQVEVEVADSGHGIPAEIMNHVTDPFFTTRRTAGGRGLGLSIAASIVREHEGVLEIESTQGQGTRVRLLLPITPPSADGQQEGTS